MSASGPRRRRGVVAGVNDRDARRRTLVVGGTGMLAGFCRCVPPGELVLAARFVSNAGAVARLDPRVERMRLDWDDGASRAALLDGLARFPDLALCVLWIHTPAHGLSAAILERLAARPRPPMVLHLFGTGSGTHRAAAAALLDRAERLGVPFRAVLLGHVETASGRRWMTDDEISARVASQIAGPR